LFDPPRWLWHPEIFHFSLSYPLHDVLTRVGRVGILGHKRLDFLSFILYRPHITRRISEFTGLEIEVRREGIALVDPGGEPRTFESLHTEMRDWIELHRAHWNQGAQAEGAEVELTAQAVERLRALKLVRVEGERVVPLAAIARHRLA